MQQLLSGLESNFNCKRRAAALGRPPCAQAPAPVQTHRRHLRRAFKCRAAGSNGKPPVKVQLRIPYRVNFGQTLGVVGAGEVLGQWDGKKAVKMTWTEGDVWQAEFTVEPGSCAQLEYKYVVINADGKVCSWKPGQNYKLDILAAKGTKLMVEETWDDGPRHVEVDVQGTEGNTVEIKTGTSVIAQEAQSAMGELKEALERQVNTLQRVSDPTAMEVLMGDRLLAAANNKAMALNRAIKAAEAMPVLPPGGGLDKEAAGAATSAARKKQ